MTIETTPEAGKAVVTLAAGDHLRIVTAGGNSRLMAVDADLLSLLEDGGPVESGTWVPEYVTDGDPFGSIAYDFQNGGIVRRGNIVVVTAEIGTSSLSGGSGNVSVTLPASMVNDGSFSMAAILVISSSWSANAPQVGQINAGSTPNRLRLWRSPGFAERSVVGDMGTGSFSNRCRFQAVYRRA